MGIFNFFSNNKQFTSQVVAPTDYTPAIEKSFGFSTPFGTIGLGNLTLPRVDNYYTSNGYVRFGEDNLYPQLLNQLYYMSGIHKACIDYKVRAIGGGGYEMVCPGQSVDKQIDIKKFEQLSRFNLDYNKIISDYVIHSRLTFKVYTGENARIIKIERIDPATVRASHDRKMFIVSNDWSKGLVNNKKYPNYEADSKANITIFEYSKFSPGQDIYAIPGYNSILNYAALDNDISYFLKNNLQNSTFYSGVITKKHPFVSAAEAENFKKTMDLGKGAKNAGRIMVLTGASGDDVPTYTALKNSDNSKIFDTTINIKNSEIAIGHNIDPQLLGIQVPGKLGNSSEQPFAYAKFNKLVVEPERQEIESAINYLIGMAQVPAEFKFKSYKIVEDLVTT